MQQRLSIGQGLGALTLIAITGVPLLAQQGGNFSLSNTRIFLSERQRSASITVTNTGTAPVAVEVRLNKWQQTTEGKDELTPAPPNSPELIVFPLVLTIPPREARNIRLSRRVPPTATEVSYRLLISEVPPPNIEQGNQVQVRFIAEHSLPVFIEPATIQRRGEVLNPQVQKGQLAFELRNTGNVHLHSQNITLAGIGGNNRPIFERKLDFAYILPGATRSFRGVALPQENCGAVERLEIRLDTTNSPPAATIPTPGGVCR